MIYSILIWTSLLFLAVDSPNADGRIVWENGVQLTWDDYLAKPDKRTEVDALSVCGIYCGPELTEDYELLFTVQAYFVKQESWSKEDVTDKLLQHEQLHFDIAELQARKLRKELSEYFFDPDNLDDELRLIYDKHFDAFEETQNNYDREAEHSLNEEKQLEWEVMIKAELELFEDYAPHLIGNYSFHEDQ